MKKVICLILAVTLTAMLGGCNQNRAVVKPVIFYYQNPDLSKQIPEGIFLGQTREALGHEEDYFYLLDLYLKGPQDDSYLQTFPLGTRLKEFSIQNSLAYITVTDQITLATDISLTVACACLCKTVIELTGVTGVQIKAETLPLRSQPYLYMDMSSILLVDNGAQDN